MRLMNNGPKFSDISLRLMYLGTYFSDLRHSIVMRNMMSGRKTSPRIFRGDHNPVHKDQYLDFISDVNRR